MNDILNKIPKPVLVLTIMVLAVVIFVLNDPPKDECDIQAEVFERNTKGLLKGYKIKKKTQFALIEPMKEKCRKGNSPGACEDYFDALGNIISEARLMNQTCLAKYAESAANLKSQMAQGLQIMSLVAWGDKPPEATIEKIGWLNESHLKTFCRMKKSYMLISTEEEMTAVKAKVFREYPDMWDEKNIPTEDGFDKRAPEDRPRAMKSSSNPKGRFDSKQINEKSLFSVPCDRFQ